MSKPKLSGFVHNIDFSKIFRFFEKYTPLMNRLVYVVSFLALVSGLATYAALSETPPFGTIHPNTVFNLLVLDLIFLLVLFFLIAQRVVSIWIRRKKKMAGSTLHVRLVMVFSLLATLPAIFMALFAVTFYHYGVESWFGERISTAVTESREVAEAYLNEHTQTIRADILAMANDMNRDFDVITTNQSVLPKFIKTQSLLRNFTEVTIFKKDGTIIASAFRGDNITNITVPSLDIVQKSDSGEVIVITSVEQRDKVYALIRLSVYNDVYLYVGRNIEEGVLKHIRLTERAVQDYSDIEGKQHGFKITMAFIFIMVSMLLLLIAVTIGLVFAEHLVKPIAALVTATERIRAGDMKARVSGEERNDESGLLARAFNRMTEQLAQQRIDLIKANQQIDDRRRFTEAVLSGISAGILSMDDKGKITLVNESAVDLIGQAAQNLIGRKLSDISPEMEKLRRIARRKSERFIESEISFHNPKSDQTRIWVVRMTVEKTDEKIKKYVATFDDVTPLIKAQRKAAWSDVARRIAHEIKNPLTPIQLSAERLRKKYLDQIDHDPETFDMFVSTIIRHVEDIGRMVDEFSSFARMPSAKKRKENISVIIQQVLFLFRQGSTTIEYKCAPLPDQLYAECDGQQISQAVTNILKNATESVTSKYDSENIKNAHIHVSMKEDDENIIIIVTDNGLGLPKNLSGNLTDPYVTSREKGTGLGLAIVAKIMEDHKGKINLSDRENNKSGAIVELIFPKKVSRN